MHPTAISACERFVRVTSFPPPLFFRPFLRSQAELKYSLAVRAGDASSGAEIVELFEDAIKADPSNPMLYINKAACLLQVRFHAFVQFTRVITPVRVVSHCIITVRHGVIYPAVFTAQYDPARG